MNLRVPASFLHGFLVVSLTLTAPSVLANKRVPFNFEGCRPDKVQFFAYTVDRQKAVEVCEVSGGYRYTFGRFTVKEGMLNLVPGGAEQITLEPGEIGRIHRDLAAGFALKRGDTFTWLEAETNGEVNLVTAKNGWDGWQTAERRVAVRLDATGSGFFNLLDNLTMPPFTYDYTNVDYD